MLAVRIKSERANTVLSINTHQVAAASRMVGDLSRTSLKINGAGRSPFSTIDSKMRKKGDEVLVCLRDYGAFA